MRKIFVAMICAAAMVTLSGCRNNMENSSGTSQSSSQSSAISSSSSSGSQSSSGSDSSQPSDSSASGSTAEKMADKALNADEWPSMETVSEQNYVNALFNEEIVLADCEDFCLMSNTISAQLYKILLVKPKADKAQAIQSAMDDYFEYVRNEGAFYPDQQASAAGAVKGKTESGYIYIIVHPNGTLIADAMLS